MDAQELRRARESQKAINRAAENLARLLVEEHSQLSKNVDRDADWAELAPWEREMLAKSNEEPEPWERGIVVHPWQTNMQYPQIHETWLNLSDAYETLRKLYTGDWELPELPREPDRAFEASSLVERNYQSD